MTLPNVTFLDSAIQMPALMLPVRSVVVELEQARVLLSPGSKLSAQQLRDAGPVTDIVAPTLLHTAGMPAAAAAHPNARLWGASGCREKLPTLKWHGVLGVDPWPHERELVHIPLEGMPQLNESVFLHARSGALLVSDLVFNIADPKGFGSWLVYSVFGTYGRFAVSRLFLRYVKDRAAFERSLQRIASLEFDHIVPSHGSVYSGGAKAKLLEALRERGY
ncbi:MAG: hypothetical protein WBV82_20265 [Myxococcaceae bacterium]